MSLRNRVERLERSRRERWPLCLHVVYPEDPEPENFPEGTVILRVVYDDLETERSAPRSTLADPSFAG